jgi:hypothetical protein
MARAHQWSVSIDELVGIFADALRALTPIADRARMPWREPNAYDDWDEIARAIYQSFVRSAIENSSDFDPQFPVPAYDQRIGSYDRNSFVSDATELSPFICLETSSTPFDTVLFAVIDEGGRVVGSRREPIIGTDLLFVRRSTPGISSMKSIVITI